MTDAQKSRPVSVDFMAGPDVSGQSEDAPAIEVIDGDFIRGTFLPASGSPHRVSETVRMEAIGSSAVPAGMDVLRKAGGAPDDRPRHSSGLLFAGFISVTVLVTFWVAGGHLILTRTPGAGVNTHDPDLRVSTVASRLDGSGIRPLLFVDGEAENHGSVPKSLHALEIAVAGDDGTLTRYRLGTAGRLLAPGETFTFSSRLDAPKNGVRTVAVTVEQ